ncbi:NmrA-like family protein [Phlyctema vagabunda]|uniref:NmrA-like family protein n=1 Tax=Phlyctema vagabunda TaxID=108571 RepID=A0ABR4P2H8_9HELO
MTSIKNVAVLGAGGNLGPSIVTALVNAKVFHITVITRSDSQSTFPPTVDVRRVDYSSEASLVEGFRGQDAIVSVVGAAALADQQRIVDAAVTSGVQRFIPSEFGVDTQSLDASSDRDRAIASILKAKIDTVAYLKKVAAEHATFTWTGIATSLFFDWGLKVGSLGFSIAKKSATIYDSGNEAFLGTNLSTIGQAVVAVLQQPQQTANRYLNIASFTTTQNEVRALLEAETGSTWTLTRASTEDERTTGEQKLAQGDRSAFGHLLKPHLFGDGIGHANPRGGLANDELGLPKEDLRETLRAAVKALL